MFAPKLRELHVHVAVHYGDDPLWHGAHRVSALGDHSVRGGKAYIDTRTLSDIVGYDDSSVKQS